MVIERSENEILERAASGDFGAFEKLVEKHEAGIYNLALRMLQDPSEAEEVLQETFLSAYKNMQGFRGESSFKTWLFRIAVNFSLMHLRKKKNRQELSYDDPLLLDNGEMARDFSDWKANPEHLFEEGELSGWASRNI